jgi:hypothetical protein
MYSICDGFKSVMAWYLTVCTPSQINVQILCYNSAVNHMARYLTVCTLSQINVQILCYNGAVNHMARYQTLRTLSQINVQILCYNSAVNHTRSLLGHCQKCLSRHNTFSFNKCLARQNEPQSVIIHIKFHIKPSLVFVLVEYTQVTHIHRSMQHSRSQIFFYVSYLLFYTMRENCPWKCTGFNVRQPQHLRNTFATCSITISVRNSVKTLQFFAHSKRHHQISAQHCHNTCAQHRERE